MAIRTELERGSEVSEAQIAVHWKEEEYLYPPAKFIGQARAYSNGSGGTQLFVAGMGVPAPQGTSYSVTLGQGEPEPLVGVGPFVGVHGRLRSRAAGRAPGREARGSHPRAALGASAP